MKRWAALLGAWLLAARALGTPAAFAEANNYWPSGLLPNFGLGTLLYVDRINTAPSRVELVCPAVQMGISAQSISHSLFSTEYRVGAGERATDDLSQFLEATNMMYSDEVLLSLELDIDNVETYSLPGNNLPDGLQSLAQPCIVRIAQLLEARSVSASHLVVLNAELMADIDVQARWARARPNLAARVMVLSHLGDVLDLNGGRIGTSTINAPFQRIGWRHDRGAWIRAAVLR